VIACVGRVGLPVAHVPNTVWSKNLHYNYRCSWHAQGIVWGMQGVLCRALILAMLGAEHTPVRSAKLGRAACPADWQPAQFVPAV
jgi:hypothetical protein